MENHEEWGLLFLSTLWKLSKQCVSLTVQSRHIRELLAPEIGDAHCVCIFSLVQI